MTRTTPWAGSPYGAPRARVRNPVGQRYLDILQSHAATDTDASSNTSIDDTHDEALDLLVLGLNTSTALDEIDFALCRFTQANPEDTLYLELLKYDSVVMPSKNRRAILDMLQADTAPPSILSQMDAEMGHVFAQATFQFTKRHSITIDDIDLIGSGGQLVSLTSDPPAGQHRANMCLGENSIICAQTGITTISDFRTTEQALGRQGAPISFMVGLLLHHPTRLRICITIGGITTLSIIPPDSEGGIDAVYDWDSGPGTVLVDAVFRHHGIDSSKYMSSEDFSTGEICQEIVDEMIQKTPYFARAPPKTTAREIFSDAMAYQIMKHCETRSLSFASTIATVIQITSNSILAQLSLFGPSYSDINAADIVMDGRGSLLTPLFLKALKASYPEAQFKRFEETGVPSNAKKAVGFAMQAMDTLLGRARKVSRNCAVQRPNTITGKIAPGLGWRRVMKRVGHFGGDRGWEGLPEVRELRVLPGGTVC